MLDKFLVNDKGIINKKSWLTELAYFTIDINLSKMLYFTEEYTVP